MIDIDAIRINFSEDQLILLNICLAFLVFGVALDIKLSDFKRLIEKPKSPIVGLISEYVLLPIIALSLIFLFKPAPSMALGMILLSTLPGGSTSNYMVHLAGANAALSVMLTSITTLGSLIVTPLAFIFLSQFLPEMDSLRQSITVEPSNIIKAIIQLVLIPVSIGMYINYKHPRLTEKIEKPIRWLSMAIFIGFVVFAVVGNWDNIKNYIHLVFLLVFLHNGLAFLVGYGFSRLNRLPEKDARAISIETGIQNTGLGLVLVFNFFDGIGGMALVMACWGVWHLISGFALAMWWSRNAKG
ncbi:MAG: bile acid:sodium symporter family protein [Bacteroidetes bacterium]|jgi:BASS family bile acid:Na+ symporter|nr:bile acid:sodium symporter family protein [Bacteroidota bacterium]MDF1863274.1 bile acid:sodium symporter family protein [Saprospiraceae bacterium]